MSACRCPRLRGWDVDYLGPTDLACKADEHVSWHRPKLLDLFCCEGGGSRGFERAGFDVYGVDLFDDYTQKRYPYPAHKGDAISTLVRLLAGESIAFVSGEGDVELLRLNDFAAIAASPPCQHASAGTRSVRKHGTSSYLALIVPTRYLLRLTGLPYVIENVRGADLIDPVELCGCMFDLTAVDTDGLLLHLHRARRFESNVHLSAPRSCDHTGHEWVGGSYGGARRDKYEAKFVRKGGYVPSIAVQQALLGIDWMTQKGMHQSLPPAYTQHVGAQVLTHVENAEALALRMLSASAA